MILSVLLKRIEEMELGGYKLEHWSENRYIATMRFSVPFESEMVIIHCTIKKEIVFVAHIHEQAYRYHADFVERMFRILKEQLSNHPKFRLPILTGETSISHIISYQNLPEYAYFLSKFNDTK